MIDIHINFFIHSFIQLINYSLFLYYSFLLSLLKMTGKSIEDQIFDFYIDGCLYLASSWISDAIMVLEMALDLSKTVNPNIHYLNILLKLAECYTRERTIPKALKMLDDVLEIEPFNCKAILLKSGYYTSVLNETEALTILNKGILNVESHQNEKFDPLYSTLIGEKMRLTWDTRSMPKIKRQCVKNTPLLEKLPPELITKIMEQLDQKSFINCLATCRDWRSSLLSISKLLGSFVLKKGMTLPMFNNYLNYIKEVAPLDSLKIDNLNIDCTRTDEKQIVKKLLASGLKIQNLKLSLIEITNFELVRMQQTTCTSLFSNLNSLNLTLNLTTKGTKSIESVIEMCSQLRSLNLNIRNFVERESYSRESTTVQLHFNSNIESISIFNGSELFLMRLFTHFKMSKLTSLQLRETVFNKQLLYIILSSTNSLKNLDLTIRSGYPFLEFLYDISKHEKRDEIIKQLESIKICYQIYQNSFDLNDRYMEPMLIPNLKTLELKKDKTPFNELMKYVKRCTSLRTFSLIEFSVGGGGTSSFSIKLLLESLPALKNLKLITHTLRGEIVNVLYREVMDLVDVRKLDVLETNSKGIVEILKKGKRIKVKKFISVIFHNNHQSITDMEIKPLIAMGVIGTEVKRYDRYSNIF